MYFDIALAVLSVVLIPAVTALMLRHFPSRYEFLMHIEQDNDRFSEVREALRRIEWHLIGKGDANISGNPRN